MTDEDSLYEKSEEEEYLDFAYSLYENPVESFDRTVRMAFFEGKALADELEESSPESSPEEELKKNWTKIESKVDLIAEKLISEYKEEFPNLSKLEKDQVDFSLVKSSIVYGILEELENKFNSD
jgi:hypothetical protein